jgi:hypothetical protein
MHVCMCVCEPMGLHECAIAVLYWCINKKIKWLCTRDVAHVYRVPMHTLASCQTWVKHHAAGRQKWWCRSAECLGMVSFKVLTKHEYFDGNQDSHAQLCTSKNLYTSCAWLRYDPSIPSDGYLCACLSIYVHFAWNGFLLASRVDVKLYVKVYTDIIQVWARVQQIATCIPLSKNANFTTACYNSCVEIPPGHGKVTSYALTRARGQSNLRGNLVGIHMCVLCTKHVNRTGSCIHTP